MDDTEDGQTECPATSGRSGQDLSWPDLEQLARRVIRANLAVVAHRRAGVRFPGQGEDGVRQEGEVRAMMYGAYFIGDERRSALISRT